ncbi:MAG: M48 family metalloprotease [Candidatus Muiribacteriota bacterium]
MNFKKKFLILMLLIVPIFTVTVYPGNVFRCLRKLVRGTRRSVEIVLGTVTSASLELSTPVVTHPEMNERLDRISDDLLPFAKRNLRYRFKILDLDYPNAFAVPGGWIYVTRELMEMTDDDELSCVLAHEIAHIEKKHSMRAFERSLIADRIIDYYSKKSETVEKNEELIRISNMIFNELSFSRSNEREADRLGVQIAYNAGYNPYGMVRFFNKLMELKDHSENQALKMLSTHPLTSDRIEYTSNYIKKLIQ